MLNRWCQPQLSNGKILIVSNLRKKGRKDGLIEYHDCHIEYPPYGLIVYLPKVLTSISYVRWNRALALVNSL